MPSVEVATARDSPMNSANSANATANAPNSVLLTLLATITAITVLVPADTTWSSNVQIALAFAEDGVSSSDPVTGPSRRSAATGSSAKSCRP